MNAVKARFRQIAPPFLLDETVYNTLADHPSIDREPPSPLRSFLLDALLASSLTELTQQTIAHRGYKDQHPENTMGAFRGAVELGAHAVETDVHLTKDGVAVLSHDATLKRCFGKRDKIIDRDWAYISEQRTIRAPHEPMPRLESLLEYLASPGQENIWLLLDLKIDNDADDLMRIIAGTIKNIQPHPDRPWHKRIVLGCWAAKFFPLAAHYLPAYSITNIGFSPSYSRQFLKIPNVSITMLQKSLCGPGGSRFIRDVRDAGRPMFHWTVNDEDFMRWSIKHEADGVITDDPKRFLEVCDEWEEGRRGIHFDRSQWMAILYFNFMIVLFHMIFFWKFGALPGGKPKRRLEPVAPDTAAAGPGVSITDKEEDR
ncbi:MAG: hypothetical protein Q9185_007189 [Variospora sp. 1 TL-2023]